MKLKTNVFTCFIALLTLLAISDHAEARRKHNPRYTPFRPADGYSIVKDSANIGLGAVFFSILPVLEGFDLGNSAGVKIDMDSGCYLDNDLGPNWFEYFFLPVDIGNRNAQKFVYDKTQILSFVRSGYRMDRKRAEELWNKYVVLKPELEREIGEIYDRDFRDHYVIGVHHRGTDKKTEAPLVPFEKTFKAVKDAIANLPKGNGDNYRIFVATDDATFLSELYALYPSKIIYNDFVRSKGDKPLHYSKDMYSSNYQKGKEAIIDLYLLSRCDFLIYPASSSFSFFSTRLRANMPVNPITPQWGGPKGKNIVFESPGE